MKKLFVAGLITETNTFSILPTTRASFESTALVRGREQTLAQPLFGGFLRPLEDHAAHLGIAPVYGLFGFAQPGGLMLQADYAALRDELLEGLRATAPVDGVLLLLHGAMAAQDTLDCEGDILARVRTLVGADVPIVAVLDPHAHLTEAMVAHASLLSFIKEYPHTDGPQRVDDVLRILRGIWDGAIDPVPAVVDCEVIGFWPTQAQPIRGLTDQFYAAERESGIVSASFVHGFPWGDTPDTGSQVLVYANHDSALAQATARTLAGAVIAQREASRIRVTPIDAALDAVTGDGLTVLADWADNPGGGAPSDATFILRRARERKMQRLAFGLFYDPALVAQCFGAGVNTQIQCSLGGKLGEFSGAPVEISGTVRGVARDARQQFFGSLEDRMGDSAWLYIDGIDVIVTSLRTQCYDPSAFAALGLHLGQHRGVVVKSSNHFHAGFGPIAKRVIVVDTPGALSADFAHLPYQRLRKPRWPRITF